MYIVNKPNLSAYDDFICFVVFVFILCGFCVIAITRTYTKQKH